MLQDSNPGTTGALTTEANNATDISYDMCMYLHIAAAAGWLAAMLLLPCHSFCFPE